MDKAKDGFEVTIEGESGQYTDGELSITRDELGGLYSVMVSETPGPGVASIRVTRARMVELYMALIGELGDVANAVADLERTTGERA